jgi:hypothetical protein
MAAFVAQPPVFVKHENAVPFQIHVPAGITASLGTQTMPSRM